ncbi:RluA family pseudouridine synthase [Spirochaetia bacterium 38H-sp]|uniref:RluA family pseudouridine synthase n=1 Tax=Rarispira pelagica TaxID=3141764 RepID=A0ABU9UA24_9SPIR
MAKIIYKDEHCIIANKEAGELVMDTGDKTAGLVKELQKEGGNIYPVNRLDRPTSGLIIFARHKKAASLLSAQFAQRAVCKLYWAIPDSPPPLPKDMLENYILENKKLNKSYILDKKKKGAEYAKMAYQVIGSGKKYVFTVIRLFTGRHHQIRAQLAAQNSPVKGDIKYGSRRTTSFGGIYLHSAFLSFLHPITGKKVGVFSLPHDDVLWNEFKKQDWTFLQKSVYGFWEEGEDYQELFYQARKNPEKLVSIQF